MKKTILTFGIAIASFVTVQAQDMPKEKMQDQDKKEMIKGEGIKKIENSAIPKEVNEALMESDYEGASIKQAYVLSGAALDQQLGDQSVEMYIGDQYPEKLYQLQVTHEDANALLYFTEEGELYASKDLEM
ncbi:hypothetical protein PZB74_11440 [Porifericola rhodea]|uniref:hypothetical protein n=1 Tax=Porifericola rhodea TaxID=930972 RepID=UPI002664ED1C|nr:hypothetical protein [Porifericola rhodea]WKN29577.1 hypothetical protein PZB74_11440 [Porifericola rhodea]